MRHKTHTIAIPQHTQALGPSALPSAFRVLSVSCLSRVLRVSICSLLICSDGTPLQYSCLENPWMEEPGGLQSMGSQRVRHD